jgi:hypothetical protein
MDAGALEQISAFLTALAAFTEEIGAGHVDTIFLRETKFMYMHAKHELLFVVEADKDDPPEEIVIILTKIMLTFENQFESKMEIESVTDVQLDDFPESIKEFLIPT